MRASSVLACGVLVACSAPAAVPVVATAASPAWLVRPSGGGQPIDPGPAPDALLDAQGCTTCHQAIVDEWRGSRHALAWTNDIFQSEYRTRPQAWCVNCHAPLTTQQRDLEGSRAAQGVDCATCHVRDGKLVAARRGPASPHATTVDPTFGTPAFCADCHEFTFPVLSARGEVTAMTEHPMQATVSSFRAGPYAHEPDGCMTCHGSRANHAMGGAHDPGMLEGAVSLAWCHRGDTVVARVTNTGAGHPVPTGDVHRHLYLRLWQSSSPATLVQAFYGRRFEPDEAGGKRTIWDSSIAPGATSEVTARLAELGGATDEPVNVELVYVYLLDEFPLRAPTEPTTYTVASERSVITDLATCPGDPSP